MPAINAWMKLAIVGGMTLATVLAYLLLQAMFPFIISMRDMGIANALPYAGNFTTFIPALKAIPLWMFLAPCFCVLVAIAMCLRLPEKA